MDSIISILNSKWAVVLAFIPGVNLLYLIFRFLTISDKRYSVSVWKIGVSVFPVWLLYRFVPDSWDWLVTHLALSVIAFLYIQSSRGGYRKHVHLSLNLMVVCGLVLLLLVTSGWWAPIVHEAQSVSAYAETALIAIVQNDEETWQNSLHPVHGEDLKDLKRAQDEIQHNGIILHNDFHFGGDGSSISWCDTEFGEAVRVEERVEFGDNVYYLVALYLEDENGSGFIEFEIIDRYP